SIGISQSAEVEIPLISVVLIEREVRVFFFGGLKQRRVFKPVTQTKRSIVMEIIVHKHVIRGCLLARRLQGRMRLQQSLSHKPSRIGNAPDSDLAVVVGNVL